MFNILYFYLFIFGLIFIIYRHVNIRYRYFSKFGVNGPRPTFLFGSIFDIVLHYNPSELEDLWLNKYGKFYGYYRGLSPVWTVADSELVRQILVKDFDKFHDRLSLGNVEHHIIDLNIAFSDRPLWKKLRPLCSLAFSSSQLKNLFPKMKINCQHLVNHIDKQSSEYDGKINAQYCFGTFSLLVFMKWALSVDINALDDPDIQLMSHLDDIVKLKPVTVFCAFILPKMLNNMIGVNMIFNQKATEKVIHICKNIIYKRVLMPDSNVKYKDLLQFLINKSYYYDSDTCSNHKDLQKFESNCPDRFTSDEIIAQVLAFFIGGYETTKTTLTWIAYELAVNPSVQQRLYEEINSAIDVNEDIDYELVSRLPYLDSVVSETLRLQNPVMRLTRQCNEECNLGHVKICKGSTVEISIHAIHHNPEYWPDPYLFNPERFMPSNRHLIKPYTYLPFSGGPRNCIGIKLALLEVKLAIIYIVGNFIITLDSKSECPPETYKMPYFNLCKYLSIAIKKRENEINFK